MIKNHIVSMCLTAMFCAVIAVCAWVSVPLPIGVSFTLQTFGVALCGCILGLGWGNVCVIVYICIGVAGFPVFSSFGAGPGVLLGPAGGFLAGFIPLAAASALSRNFTKLYLQLTVALSGLVLCHIMGILWLAVQSGSSFFAAAAAGSLPFLLKDAVSVAAAVLVSRSKIIKKLTI